MEFVKIQYSITSNNFMAGQLRFHKFYEFLLFGGVVFNIPLSKTSLILKLKHFSEEKSGWFDAFELVADLVFFFKFFVNCIFNRLCMNDVHLRLLKNIPIKIFMQLPFKRLFQYLVPKFVEEDVLEN